MADRHHPSIGALIAMLAIMLLGCAPSLPVDPRWVGDGCRGVGTDVVIHGSAADPKVTWVTSPETGQRTEIIWPVGYSARFLPALEVLDETGRVVAREGDHLGGWCRTANTPDGVPIRVDGSEVVTQP